MTFSEISHQRKSQQKKTAQTQGGSERVKKNMLI
jgi:hypothetical protein